MASSWDFVVEPHGTPSIAWLILDRYPDLWVIYYSLQPINDFLTCQTTVYPGWGPHVLVPPAYSLLVGAAIVKTSWAKRRKPNNYCNITVIPILSNFPIWGSWYISWSLQGYLRPLCAQRHHVLWTKFGVGACELVVTVPVRTEELEELEECTLVELVWTCTRVNVQNVQISLAHRKWCAHVSRDPLAIVAPHPEPNSSHWIRGKNRGHPAFSTAMKW